MNRRELMLLAAATAIACNPALAQVTIPRIGFVQVGSRQENQSLLEAFRGDLSALGWTDGSNIAILDRSAGERTEQLPYFPYNPDARVDATVEPLPADDQGEISIDTGGEDGTISYRRLCRLATPFGSLTLLRMLGYGGGLFLPFRDGTSGRETYGGGRYLTDTIKGTFGRGLVFEGEAVTLDFNYAYNPSCVYNYHTFCPLAPAENTLSEPVRAGELTYPFPCRAPPPALRASSP